MDSAYRMGSDSRAVPQKALRLAEAGRSADSAAKTEGTEDSVGPAQHPAQHPARWEPAARADLEWVRTASESWGAVAAAVVVAAAVALAAVLAREEAVADPENRLRMAGRTAVAAVVEEAVQCTPVQYRR